MIITKKIIFVLDAIIQIMQSKTVNTHLIQIKHLQKKIKLNHNFLKHESTLELKSYVLVILMKMIKSITTFTLLLTTKITNSTSIDFTSIQKTSQTLSQDRFRAEVYFFTQN